MMHIKNSIYIIVLLILAGCIKAYEPELKNNSVQKYVVQGAVSSIEGYQEVSVSLTSQVNEPKYIGVSRCQVEIIDSKNNKFLLQEYDIGKYRIWMNQEELLPDLSYKVNIITPEGEMIASSFDQMSDGPEVGDVYYEIEEIPTNNPNISDLGIRFLTNINANENQSRFYQWKLTETWEYHSEYPIEYYYDGQVQQISPPDYSQMVCWSTIPIREIFTLSTVNLSDNSYNGFRLNFVENSTSRLAVLYSLWIEQISLSQDAYTYWDQLRQNSTQDGGLYASQPIAIKGNMSNITHPEKDVLGYFQASKVSTKRIFVDPVDGLLLDFNNRCDTILLERGLIEIEPRDYPAYLMTIDGQWTLFQMNEECVQCTSRGGTTVKPNFWPTK